MKLSIYLAAIVLILGGSVLYALPPGQESGPHLVIVPDSIILPTLAAGSYINDTEAAIITNEGTEVAHIISITVGCPDSTAYVSAANITSGGRAYLGLAVNYSAEGAYSCAVEITYW